MAVMRNDKGKSWVLHRLNTINSRILKIKVELTPDAGGINVRVPVVADVTLAL